MFFLIYNSILMWDGIKRERRVWNGQTNKNKVFVLTEDDKSDTVSRKKGEDQSNIGDDSSRYENSIKNEFITVNNPS